MNLSFFALMSFTFTVIWLCPPEYPGTERFACSSKSVRLVIKDPGQAFQHSWMSKDGASFGSDRQSPDDIEIVHYPLTFVFLIENVDGTIRNPVWRTIQMKEHPTHPGWVEYDGWCSVEMGISDIKPNLTIEVPVSKEFKTMFLLMKEWQRKRTPDFDHRWHLMEFSKDQIQLALDHGISIPLLSDVPSILEHNRMAELLASKRRALEEFETLKERQLQSAGETHQ